MKKLVKTLFASVLAVSMLIPTTSVFATSPATNVKLTPQADILAKMPKTAPKGQVIYGSTTDLDANYYSGWTNNATNADIKTLIYGGYYNVEYTKDSGYVINPIAIKAASSVVNADKSKTYTFELNTNLTYNDGSKITAKDYIFSYMLPSSPEFKALGSTTSGADILVGYDEFRSGKTKTFSGIRLLGDYKFSVTIAADELPNYWELALIQTGPDPMAVIAPGVKLTDDGKGATLSAEFTAELLEKTMLDPKTGYRYNPKVTPGPYQFDNFDEANKTCTVTVNPKFLGNLDGTKPQIQKLIIKKCEQATMMDELSTGKVDLLAGIGDGDNINKGLDLADAKKASYIEYPRAGYGKIQFQCDFGPTQFAAVRQAIAWCLDRAEFCRQFTQGYGIVVHGPYGASQWEYIENKAALDKNLINYNLNLEKARELLKADGWVLDKDGKAYAEPEKLEKAAPVRYKKVGDKLMPLVIEWCSSENNQVSDLLKTMLPSEAIKVGIQINQYTVTFATLTANLSRTNGLEPKFHMFNLATSFTPVSTPWYTYSTDPELLGGNYNSCYILNDKLNDAVQAMKTTDPTDKAGWSKKWLTYITTWNELCPEIPLYSNQYHDFFNANLQGYSANPLWTYRYAIQRASVK